jgi:DNA-binding PadR family transcriptional regulator
VGIPNLTALQFLILEQLLEAPMSGRDLRTGLAKEGEEKTGPAFYQLMARMEDGGYVVGSYEQKIVEGQIIRERRYVITASGTSAWESTRDFYVARVNKSLAGGLMNG